MIRSFAALRQKMDLSYRARLRLDEVRAGGSAERVVTLKFNGKNGAGREVVFYDYSRFYFFPQNLHSWYWG